MSNKSNKQDESNTKSSPTSLGTLLAMTMGTDGGIGKTASANHTSDCYQELGIPIARINFDVEKRERGSFASFHRAAIDLDLRTPAGADAFVDIVLNNPHRIGLADMGANVGKFALDWFQEMYEPMREAGVKLLFIVSITSSPGSVQALLRWASVLGDRPKYLLFETEKDGDDFGYLHDTSQGKEFLQMAKPPIIRVRKQLPHIQAELDNRAFTLRQALSAPKEALGPVLAAMTSQMRIRGHFRHIQAQLMQVREVLLP